MKNNHDEWNRLPDDYPDEDITAYLNEKYDGEEPVHRSRLREWGMKAVGLFTALAFLAVAFQQLFTVYPLSSLEFVAESRRLAEDPEIHTLREAVVVIHTGGSRGTGFNIDPGGIIVTNHHVVSGSDIVTVGFAGGRTFTGAVWARMPDMDLAIVRIDGDHLPVLKMETGADPVIGDEVLIIGNPLGLPFIVMEGEVAGRAMPAGWDRSVLVIRAPVHQGSSGSPVINSDGRVVGIIFATVQTEQDEILGLAVPVDYFFEVSSQD